MSKNWVFILLLSLAALSLAGTAAYFSVFGLSKLFAAAGWGITILAASLEFAKLVTVSYVYRFWNTIKKSLRAFYVFAVVFIMFLTSIGIYGFLTGAYQQSANKMQLRDSQIQIAQNKKELFVSQLDRFNKSIESSSNRINTLSGLRNQQEQRLDKLYNQKSLGSARRTETQIAGSDEQINILNSDISNLMKQINVVNDSIAFYDHKIAELNSSDVSNEIGPYKFVAQLTGIPIDNIVNIVAILIVLVFDPLAVTLLIGVNQLTMMRKKEEDDDEKEFYKDKNINQNNESSNSSIDDITTTTTTTDEILSTETTTDEITTTTTTTDEITTTTTTTDEITTTTTTTDEITTTTTTTDEITTTTTTTDEITTTTTTTDEITTTKTTTDEITTTTTTTDEILSTETTTEKNMKEFVENIFDDIDNELEIKIVTDSNENLVDVIKISNENNINNYRMTTYEEDILNNKNSNDDIQQIASISGKVNSSYFVSGK